MMLRGIYWSEILLKRVMRSGSSFPKLSLAAARKLWVLNVSPMIFQFRVMKFVSQSVLFISQFYVNLPINWHQLPFHCFSF